MNRIIRASYVLGCLVAALSLIYRGLSVIPAIAQIGLTTGILPRNVFQIGGLLLLLAAAGYAYAHAAADEPERKGAPASAGR
jgi:hypothetical protein